MTNTLEIDSVILEFGSKRVLQNVYLKCETGKITGLLGRNGSGKSCLMNIMYGELIPNDKSIRFNGESFIDNKRNPQDLRYLPQFSFIPKSLSNLSYSIFIITISVIKIIAFYRLYLETYFKMKDNEYNKN